MADFRDVDDSMFDDPASVTHRLLIRPVLVAALYVLLVGSVVSNYEEFGPSTVTIAGYEMALFTWMSVLAFGILGLVFGPSLVGNRSRARSFIATFAQDRLAALALLGLVGFVLASLWGKLFLGPVEFNPAHSYNPPIGATVEAWRPTTCLGRETATACHGTWNYPFGTDSSGRDILRAVLHGIWTSLQVGITTAVIAGGIGTAVGVTAGTIGGRADDLLMRYVDLQSAIPAFFAFILIFTVLVVNGDLILMVMVFGLLSWGGLARLVRSEVMQLRSEGYVEAARASGAGRLFIIRTHVLPNVSSGVFVPLTTLVPTYMLFEASLSYLGLLWTHPDTISLGAEVASGFEQTYTDWWKIWWDGTFPAVALMLLIVCLLVVGDRAATLLDPRSN